jgi:hypothetical protein
VRCSFEDTGKNGSDLTAGLARVGGVTNDIIRDCPLFVQWPLQIFPPEQFRLVPIAAAGDASKPDFKGGVHEYDGIALIVQPRLKQ